MPMQTTGRDAGRQAGIRALPAWSTLAIDKMRPVGRIACAGGRLNAGGWRQPRIIAMIFDRPFLGKEPDKHEPGLSDISKDLLQVPPTQHSWSVRGAAMIEVWQKRATRT